MWQAHVPWVGDLEDGGAHRENHCLRKGKTVADGKAGTVRIIRYCVRYMLASDLHTARQ
jgi:hypothetical protein